MPELPEVEVVRQGLAAQLLGAEITHLQILTPKVVQASPEQLEALRGQTIQAVERRAKYLIVVLSQDRLLIHLRMTGQLLVVPPEASGKLWPLPFTYYQRPLGEMNDRHTHGLLHFTNGFRLAYRDVRKFGRVLVLTPTELAQWPGLLKLGSEPLGPDFRYSAFARVLQVSRRSIKALLLDQTQVAGLGNIYVDEALFVARVRPQRLANSLKPAEIKRLFQAIPAVLNKGIAAGGTSLKDYLHPDGQRGQHQEHLWVYGRTAQPCLQCGSELVRTVVAQRGTHYCAACQK